MFSKPKSPTVFTCTYAEGKVEVIRKDLVGEAAISGLDINASLPENTLLCTGEKSLAEITSDSFLIRLGAMTVLESVTNESLKVFSGSILICLPEDSEITLESEKTSISIKGKLTAIMECTSNGGFKLIHVGESLLG